MSYTKPLSLAQKLQVKFRLFKLKSAIPEYTNQNERVLARHLFSILGYFEDIAVILAERGNCVKKQLEDEIVHRQIFYMAAEKNGGLVEPLPEITAVRGFIINQSPRDSFTLLNLVGEVWLEPIFETLEKSTLAPAIFHSIQEDEERHIHDATEMDISRDIQGKIDHLHDLLIKLTRSPILLSCLWHYVGGDGIREITRNIIRNQNMIHHDLSYVDKRVHRYLRVSASLGKAMKDTLPEPLPLSEWEKTKMWLFGCHNAMRGHITVPLPHGNKRQIEFIVLKALSAALEQFPRANRSTRALFPQRGRIYQPNGNFIGLRRRHKRSDAIITVAVNNAYKLSLNSIRSKVNKRLKVLNEHDYQAIPDMRELIPVLPPSPVSWIITYAGVFTGYPGGGDAPLTDIEGACGCLSIGSPVDGKIELHFQVDHRAMDGEHMVRLMDLVGKHIENGGAVIIDKLMEKQPDIAPNREYA